MRLHRSAAQLTFLALASCGPDPSTPASATPTPSTSAPVASAKPSASSPVASASTSAKPAEPPGPPPGPRPSDADLKKLSKANNAFAFAMWGKIADKKGDLAFSPFSAETALTMTWLGAKGETAAQMKKVLGYDVAATEAADVGGRYAKSLGGPVTIRIANRLFGEKTYAFDKGFLETTDKLFGAPLEPTDFKSAFEPSRVHINQWVADQTHDRIKNLIPAGGVSGETRLALVNAIYFLGDWEQQFKKEATQPAPFHTSESAQHDVPMMNQRLHAAFAEDGAVSVLDLPYVGGNFSMTFVLPKKSDELGAIEKKLTSDGFDKWISGEKTADVNLALPKFTIDPAEATNLGAALVSLGMSDAFDRDKADFTGIANPPSPADRLFISKVFHKAFVKVDEKGTEAAAATAVVMERAGAAAPTEPPKEFRADHPFLFFLRDVKSNTILFAGRVADPVAK